MKFICEECDEPCILEVGDGYNLTADVLGCVCKNSCYCKWKEYYDGKVANLQPKVAKLPKLTAEVFDRPDCPEWAEFAAVDGCGRGFYYETFPRLYKHDRFFLLSTVHGKTQRIPGKFDGANWINSIVARLKKTSLPDWCKRNGWVWDHRNGYGKIKSVRDDRSACYIEFDGGAGDFVPEAFKELKQARLRPFNADEMKSLVGKVVCDADGNKELITGWSADMEKVRICSIHYSAQRLLDGKFTIDGSLCGVLEHLENGEWVR